MEKEIVINSNKWIKVVLSKERDFYVVFNIEWQKESENTATAKINNLKVFSTEEEAKQFFNNYTI